MLYSNALYTTLFGMICGIWIVSELLGPVRWSRKSTGEQREHGVMPVLFLFGSLGLVLCFLFPLLLPAGRIAWQPEAFFLGGIVTFVGMGWRWYAIKTLGTYFTATLITHQNQPVVQHGPYRLIRHPSYSGVLLITIGLGFMMGNWASLIVFVAGMAAILLYRIPREEKELLQHLGIDYRNYMQRTKRLIPYIF